MFSSSASAREFKVTDLPKGKNITLLSSVTSEVPLGTRVRLTATDEPQTVKFEVNSKKRRASIRLAVYDKNLARVLYTKVSSGVPFLYSFKGMSSIFIQPEKEKSSRVSKGLSLRIKSDKPLSIAN